MTSKRLVIVESPAKAKTISKYLGGRYIVKSSVGHVRDLPTSGSAKKSKSKSEAKSNLSKEEQMQLALVQRMGIDPFHNWQADYEILPGKTKIVAELKKLATGVDEIYLATDRDREGEAIAWHLQQVIGGDSSRFKRVVFNEITKKAIQAAFSEPTILNINCVNAQQARRFMDRIVGYMVSPLLWKKIARGLSAGRVQSVAVKLLVERERAIKVFVPQEYWRLHADLLTNKKQSLTLEVTHCDEKVVKFSNQQQINSAVKVLKQSSYRVTGCEEKPTISKAPAPFITSTLQQAASHRLSFNVKKTMMLAQRLYEAGHITYMRTDSTNISQSALAMVRAYIEEIYDSRYLPKEANKFSNKANSQEAHEAIRPTDITLTVTLLNQLERDAQRLYELIWQQFVACQMTEAQYSATIITVSAENYSLRAKGRTLRFDGWTKILPVVVKKEDVLILPKIAVGSELVLEKLKPEQHFTKPPTRYSEAGLVKELEKKGIGRPSTYAAIISTIQDRGYVRVENRRFYAEKMGEIVTDRLCESFLDLMNYDFTAQMEQDLDKVANVALDWKALLDNFFAKFQQQLADAEKVPEQGGMRPNNLVETTIQCPTCSKPMSIRTASTGVFLGCSGYNLPPKTRCKTTLNLIAEKELFDTLALDDEDAETLALRARQRCVNCGTAMDSYLIDAEHKLYICGNNPLCDGYLIEEGNFKIKGQQGLTIPCDKCGTDMQLKSGPFGKYMGCTNPDCKNTRKILKNGDIAPPKEDPVLLPELKCHQSDAYFVLRDGAAGIFLAAHNFPKSRETRAPLVEELVQFKARLSEKFNYLTQAPTEDPAGNKTIVRFNRIAKEQYVSSEIDGKATGWAAYYRDGQWVPMTVKKSRSNANKTTLSH